MILFTLLRKVETAVFVLFLFFIIIFPEPLTTRNSRGALEDTRFLPETPASSPSFGVLWVTCSLLQKQGQDVEGIEPGSWFVLCTWETVLLRGAKAAWSLPASWVCITGVSLGKLLNLNTRDVSPCEPQDHSSTSLTCYMDPPVNAREAVSSKCVQASVPPHLSLSPLLPGGYASRPWASLSARLPDTAPPLYHHCWVIVFWTFQLPCSGILRPDRCPLFPVPLPAFPEGVNEIEVFRLSTKVRLV